MMTLLTVLIGLSYAETFDTVSRQVVTNYTVNDFVNAVIPNIGQSSHYVSFIYDDITSGSCTISTPSVPIFLEADLGSTPNAASSWTRISPTYAQLRSVGGIGNVYTGAIVAAGAYPRIRLSRYNPLPAGCRLNAWYMGTLPAPGMPQTFLGALGAYDNATASGSVAFSNFVLLNPTDTNARFVIYAMEIYNAPAGNNITITEHETSCAGSTVGTLFNRLAVPTNTEFARPRHFIPFHTSKRATYICLNTTAAGFVDVRLTYRVE